MQPAESTEQTIPAWVGKILPSSLILILTNCVPLFGVLFLGWNVLETVLLYWMESGIIGLFTIILLLLMPILPADRKGTPFNAKLILIPFFAVLYGGFMAGHLALIMIFLGQSDQDGIARQAIEVFQKVPAIRWALLSLCLNHGYSFFVNYILPKKYLQPLQKQNLWHIIGKPFKRIFVMQFSILFSAFGILLLRLPQPMVAALVAVKTFFDLKAHKKERERDNGDLKLSALDSSAEGMRQDIPYFFK